VAKDEQTRVQQIKQYVLARLREELASAPRGAQAQLAKRLGVSGAHLSNMLSPNPTRQPGEDFRRKVAAHWEVSYAQLEALALGEDPPPASRKVGSGEPSQLAAALREYRWMGELPQQLRLVVRRQAHQHFHVTGADYPRDEWHQILTGLEREALAMLARRAETKRRRAR
jgi:transcriptional regulator with XRE-family HTH domain